jgi:hypothetical protein
MFIPNMFRKHCVILSNNFVLLVLLIKVDLKFQYKRDISDEHFKY